jgi:hypothetical protein
VNREYNYALIELDILEYDLSRLHKIFDHHFILEKDDTEDYKKQFSEYQRAYEWIKINGYENEIDTKMEIFFKNTKRSEYLIVFVSSNKDELNNEETESKVDDEINYGSKQSPNTSNNESITPPLS